MKNTIHYVLILDQSGSMNDLKKEVISSYNEQVDMILRLKNEEPEAHIKLTLCVFNHRVDLKFLAQEMDQVKKLTVEDYNPDSFTALFDAIGSTFVTITELVQPGDQVFIAIFTDGLENASKNYTAGDINLKISVAEKLGWNVRFFCRYEDRIFYQQKFHLPDNSIVGLSMDQAGFNVMDNEIHFRIKDMVKKQKKQRG